MNGHFAGGFKVKILMNLNGAASETAYAVTEDATFPVTRSPTTDGWSTTFTASHTNTSDSRSKFLHYQIDYMTTPSDAEPQSTIKANIELLPAGQVWWELSDCDWIDGGDNSAGVSVGLSYIACATFNYTWNYDDPHESMIGGDWSFGSDAGFGLSRDPDYGSMEGNSWLYKESGWYDEDDLPHSETWGLSSATMKATPGSGYLAGQKGTHKDATYTINVGGGVRSDDKEPEDWCKGKVQFTDASYKVVEVRYYVAP